MLGKIKYALGNYLLVSMCLGFINCFCEKEETK